MPWVYRIIVIVLIVWGLFTGGRSIYTNLMDTIEAETIHIAEGAYLFTILDSKESEWFYE